MLKGDGVNKIIIFPSDSAARPGFQKPAGSTPKSYLEPIPMTEKGQLPADYTLEDPDSHYIYVCKKIDEPTLTSDRSTDSLTDDTLQR